MSGEHVPPGGAALWQQPKGWIPVKVGTGGNPEGELGLPGGWASFGQNAAEAADERMKVCGNCTAPSSNAMITVL